MQNLVCDIVVKKELRPCLAREKKALFHEWSRISKIRDAILQGCVSGVVADTFGIVEYEDGRVDRVLPEHIQFLDNRVMEYCFAEKE